MLDGEWGCVGTVKRGKRANIIKAERNRVVFRILIQDSEIATAVFSFDGMIRAFRFFNPSNGFNYQLVHPECSLKVQKK